MLNNQKIKNGISWTDFTWNPIQAECLYDCDYCYVKRINKRFNRKIDNPTFKEDYMSDLNSKQLKFGDKIFVGSTTDMFGHWIPSEWIQKIINKCIEYPKYIFIFLTKNPKRYSEFIFPKNCWLGTTCTTHEDSWRSVKLFNNNNNLTFISLEPLLDGNISDNIMLHKWIIIGANSNPSEPKPPDKWIDDLLAKTNKKNIPVWIKSNYKYYKTIKELPKNE